jgi:hypothetical protein
MIGHSGLPFPSLLEGRMSRHCDSHSEMLNSGVSEPDRGPFLYSIAALATQLSPRRILRDCNIESCTHVAVLRFIQRANGGMRLVWRK